MSRIWETFNRHIDTFLNGISQSIEESFRNGLRAPSDMGKLERGLSPILKRLTLE